MDICWLPPDMMIYGMCPENDYTRHDFSYRFQKTTTDGLFCKTKKAQCKLT